MSVNVNIPKFLGNTDLPLMQPALAKLLHNKTPWLRPVAQVVSEYACPPDQVETRAMIAFFREKITPEYIQFEKKELFEVSSALGENPWENERLFRGSTPIKNCTVRKLVALACLYFKYKTALFVRGLSLDDLEHSYEGLDFLGRIPGMTIAQTCHPKKDSRLCHTFVFGGFDWYKKIQPNTKLLVEPKRVLDFLRSKGFVKSKMPCEGQIVVYHTATSTKHFAKVSKVESDGEVIVKSKFGSHHVYEHSIGLVPCEYGNSVTFLNPPKIENSGPLA